MIHGSKSAGIGVRLAGGRLRFSRRVSIETRSRLSRPRGRRVSPPAQESAIGRRIKVCVSMPEGESVRGVRCRMRCSEQATQAGSLRTRTVKTHQRVTHVTKRRVLERSAATFSPSLKRVARKWQQLTLSQKTFVPKFFGCPSSPTFSGLAHLFRFPTSVDVTDAS